MSVFEQTLNLSHYTIQTGLANWQLTCTPASLQENSAERGLYWASMG